MDISAETYILRERFNDETAVRMLSQAGFDCYDYSFYWASKEKDMLGEDYLQRAAALRKAADSVGIRCNQAHAPFGFSYKNKFCLSDLKFLRIVRAMEFASLLGAKSIVVHIVAGKKPKGIDFTEHNKSFYLALLPYCKRFGISISLENLFGKRNIFGLITDRFSCPKQVTSFVKGLNSEYFNICLDIGHCLVTRRKPEKCILEIGGTLIKCLHIHDNNGFFDSHLLPFSKKADWPKIIRALREIGYKGELTLEIFGYLGKLEDNNLLSGLIKAKEVADALLKL